VPPPPYARQGGEVIAAQLAKIGIVAKMQNVEWAQWLSGTYGNKNYDLTMISHVEPFDLGNFAKPDYYWGYNSPKFNARCLTRSRTPAPRRPRPPAGRCAAPAGRRRGAWFSVPAAMGHRGQQEPQGLWKDMPIFVNDLSALSWS
jgi:peptide/nickel transport system substrate-binding protein